MSYIEKIKIQSPRTHRQAAMNINATVYFPMIFYDFFLAVQCCSELVTTEIPPLMKFLQDRLQP
jgi:hypothetical protein